MTSLDVLPQNTTQSQSVANVAVLTAEYFS